MTDCNARLLSTNNNTVRVLFKNIFSVIDTFKFTKEQLPELLICSKDGYIYIKNDKIVQANFNGNPNEIIEYDSQINGHYMVITLNTIYVVLMPNNDNVLLLDKKYTATFVYAHKSQNGKAIVFQCNIDDNDLKPIEPTVFDTTTMQRYLYSLNNNERVKCLYDSINGIDYATSCFGEQKIEKNILNFTDEGIVRLFNASQFFTLDALHIKSISDVPPFDFKKRPFAFSSQPYKLSILDNKIVLEKYNIRYIAPNCFNVYRKYIDLSPEYFKSILIENYLKI